MKTKKGFTLVELMIVIAVIGVMAAALGGWGRYENSRKRARDAQRMSEVEQARADLEMIRADEGAYPVSVTFDNCDTCSYSGGGACYTITATLDCSVDGRDCSSPPYTYSRSCP